MICLMSLVCGARRSEIKADCADISVDRRDVGDGLGELSVIASRFCANFRSSSNE